MLWNKHVCLSCIYNTFVRRYPTLLSEYLNEPDVLNDQHSFSRAFAYLFFNCLVQSPFRLRQTFLRQVLNPPTRSSPLFNQHHFFSLNKASRFNSIDIHPGSQATGIKLYRMPTRLLFFVANQCSYLLPKRIKYLERYFF